MVNSTTRVSHTGSSNTSSSTKGARNTNKVVIQDSNSNLKPASRNRTTRTMRSRLQSRSTSQES